MIKIILAAESALTRNFRNAQFRGFNKLNRMTQAYIGDIFARSHAYNFFEFNSVKITA